MSDLSDTDLDHIWHRLLVNCKKDAPPSDLPIPNLIEINIDSAFYDLLVAMGRDSNQGWDSILEEALKMIAELLTRVGGKQFKATRSALDALPH